MSRAFQCDRCKTFHPIGGYDAISVRTLNDDSKPVRWIERWIELCLQCKANFDKWERQETSE